jgi:uncharacterized protein
MTTVLAAEIFQVAGAIIVGAALIQVVVMLVSTYSRFSYASERRGLVLEGLRHQVNAASAHSQAEQIRALLSWQGTRKFRIDNKVEEGGGICSFYLKPHDGKALPSFNPGQFLTFKLRIPGQEKPIIRCYSLSDSPFASDYYRVSIKRVPPPRDKPDLPPGLSSNFFHDQLQEGDLLDIRAPGGHFFLDHNAHTPVVLIGGGVGLTPVLSMLNAICASGSKREAWFFYGVRNGEEHVMKEHLAEIERTHENVHINICYSDPTDDDVLGVDYDHDGRVGVDLFKSKVDGKPLLPSNNYDFYLCGPPPMMDSLTGDLATWGVPEDRIHFEAFGPATVKKTKPKVTADDAAAENGETIQVEFNVSGKTVAWNADSESLLELAEAHDVAIDSGCRAGNCGTCVTAIKSGEVDYINEPGEAPEDGSCLACITVPKSNLSLDA